MNIKQLKETFGEGKGLTVIMDNDSSMVYYEKKDYDGDEPESIEIFTGDGYTDCEELWKTLFPEADVDWC